MVRRVVSVVRAVRSAILPVASGSVYFLAAVASLKLTLGNDGIATLWPPSGILLAVLLLAPRHRIAWHVAAAAMGAVVANLVAGNPPLTALTFAVANIGESTLAAWLLRRGGRGGTSFFDRQGLLRFGGATIAGAMLSAMIASTTVIAASDRLFLFWLSWLSTDLLGIFVVTPVILIFGRALHRPRTWAVPKSLATTMAVFTLIAVVSAVTFAQSTYPPLFVPMLAVLLAVFWVGPLGAAGGVLIVAIVSTSAMTLGIGPIAQDDIGPLQRSLLLQCYLLTTFAASLPIATLLAARDRLLARLAEKMRLLELAESAAEVGHWRLDTGRQRVTWSQGVFRIHGIPDTMPPTFVSALAAYHPDDRAMVTRHIDHAIANHAGFEFRARIVRPDGEVRQVFSRGEIDRINDDGSFCLFGITRDVTVQVAHETLLNDARVRAEEAARLATIMAETDQLTGIANRRRTMTALELAVSTADVDGGPVSIAIFDIDHFKQVNDRHGHATGDQVLRRVARMAADELRKADVIGRFGGEEFVLILPDTTATVALRIAERVRAAIEKGNHHPPVTISVGVAERLAGETGEALLRRADQALYAAKHEGRNTLRLAA
ncbi:MULTISPECIES: sensor domain-containing diguanylate cyclase [unclassified Sphingomonas]|uniref:sensor domain-containing diguanylate cyclase n=1 Tax=unclassified Sphingomonas TaxID=196159 RepID=UPI0009E74DF4|nr:MULTISPECIES: sensor domain-containing diguanylate cyclase [unclassified Sphingomonas]